MICVKCETELPNESLFCLHCGLPQRKETLENYYQFLSGINENFCYDFLQLSQLVFQSGETPIVVTDWSYIYLHSNRVSFGYLVITTNRYISISFEKEVGDKQIIDVGVAGSKLISSSFSPLSDLDLKSRHITQIPLSYITSIQQIECPIDDERLYQKRVFCFTLGTPDNNDFLRFFLYSSEKAERVQKTISHYNPSVKTTSKTTAKL